MVLRSNLHNRAQPIFTSKIFVLAMWHNFVLKFTAVAQRVAMVILTILFIQLPFIW